MKSRLGWILAWLVVAAPAVALDSHFYIPPRFCHAYPGTNAVHATDTGGADPKFAWAFPAGINATNAILCEVWYPESATTNSFAVQVTYQYNDNDGTKNGCFFSSATTTLVGSPWSGNLGGGGSNPALASSPETGFGANTDDMTSMNGLQFYENDDGVTVCPPAVCKNHHGQILIARQLQVNCADEIPVDILLTGIDVFWTP